MHDMSKYSPAEFIPGVLYFQGDRSPNNAQREHEGYSSSWLHHKGRNKHHYEYWCDNFDQGTDPIKMPFNYALELICDYLAANKAYSGDGSIDSEIEWWKIKKQHCKMHPHTISLVTGIFNHMKIYGIENTLKDSNYIKILKIWYESQY